MFLEKQVFIPAEREKVLAVFTNPVEFSQCIPNLVKMERLGETSFRLYVTQKFVFLRSNITMDWSLMEMQEASGKLKISGKGIGSKFEAFAYLKLLQKDQGTDLRLTVDISVSGLLKPIPESVIIAAADQLATEIFACVGKKCALKS